MQADPESQARPMQPTRDMFDDAPAQPPIARKRDPVTSKMAAIAHSEGGRELDKKMMLKTIAKNPGHTAKEYSVILKAAGVDWLKAAQCTTKRISDLKADGAVIIGRQRKCEKTGKRAQTYYVSEDYL